MYTFKFLEPGESTMEFSSLMISAAFCHYTCEGKSHSARVMESSLMFSSLGLT